MWAMTTNFIDGQTKEDGNKAVSFDYEEGRQLPYTFRIYDDDGELYFEGKSDDNESEDAFSPLDEYAMPNYGATEIHYKNKTGRGFSLL